MTKDTQNGSCRCDAIAPTVSHAFYCCLCGALLKLSDEQVVLSFMPFTTNLEMLGIRAISRGNLWSIFSLSVLLQKDELPS